LIVAAVLEALIASSIRYQVLACNACANVVTVVPALFWMNRWLVAESSTRAAVPVALRMSSSRITFDGRVGPGL